MGRKYDALISPTRAAQILGVNQKTVHRWCVAAERGEPSKITHVTRENNGYMRISLAVVLAVKATIQKEHA